MLLPTLSFFVTAAAFAQAASIVKRQSNSSSVPTLPANDPFYAPSVSTYSSLSPGSVIASRPVDTIISLLPVNISIQAYQVSYRTQGPAGEAYTAITTVWVPTPRQNGLLVAYNNAEDSSNINCAPSYSWRQGVNVTRLGVDAGGDFGTIGMLLLRGYVVTSPDYETNELSAFGVGPLAARGVLDGIRATLNFNASGLSANSSKIAVFGYSGGAIATGWAIQTAPSYAPELNIVTASLGGLPANLTNNGLFLDGTVGSGFIPINWVGLSKYYPSFATALNSILTPNGTAALAVANSSCLYNVLAAYPFQNFFNGTKYQTLGAGLLNNTILRNIFAAQTLAVNASTIPKVPMLATHCVADQTVPFGQAYTAYNSWCGFGAPPITFKGDLNTRCTHSSEFIYSLPDYFDNIANAFAGNPGNSSCTFTNRTLTAPSANAIGENATALYSTYLAAAALM